MKYIVRIATALAVLLTTACDQPQEQKTPEQHKKELDSFSRATYGESADEHIKKMTDAVIAKALLDTVGLSKAPVKVIKARIIQQEYSHYRNVLLQYKNVSGKTISAIRFSWYGTNGFNEPADMGSSVAEGFGGGFTDEELKAGRSETSTWDVLSRDAKKIKLAWPTKVSFTDGTSWEIK